MTAQDPETSYFPSIEKKYGQPVSHWLELIDQNTIVARGCLIAGVGCKSQTWTRVR